MTPPKLIHLVPRGAFAHEVAPLLRSGLVDVGHQVSQAPETEPGASFGLLVADQDDPLVDAFAEKCRADGLPSLTVVHACPDVRIGPMDVPGTPLCATCFTTRVRQHDPSAELDRPEVPDRELAVEIDGFPPYLVALVVALVLGRLAELDRPEAARRNEVTVVNTATLVTRTFPVIPVNQCPTCADQEPIGVWSGGRPMFPELDRVPR